MAYSGNTPWHALGTKLDGPMTSLQAIQAAHLDYDVTKEKLYLSDGRQAPAYCTMTSDTHAMLGVVGEQYTPLQNRAAFEFFDVLVGEGQARFETAGALGQGERVWLLARMEGGTFEAVKGDPIATFNLLSNSHDGSSGVEDRFTSERVVCANTLAMALRGSAAVVKIRHTQSVEARVKLAAGILATYQRHFALFKDAMCHLAKVRITDAMVEEFEQGMFGKVDETPEGRGRTILMNKLAKFEELLVKGAGTDIPGVCGTAYGMVNAYTEWADFHSQVKGTTDRTSAIIFGNAAKEKERALELALVLAK